MSINHDEKETALRKEIEECEKLYGSHDIQLVLHLNRMAQHLKKTGCAASTVELYERGLAILEKEYGSDDLSVALFAGYLAAAHAAAGSEAEAAGLLHRATGILDIFKSQDPVGVASAFCLLGDDFLQVGRIDEGALLLTVALRSLPGRSDDDVRWRIWFSLSRLSAAKDDKVAAIAFAKRSVNVLQKIRQEIALQSTEGMQAFSREVAAVYDYLGGMLFDALRLAELQQVEAMQQEEACFELLTESASEESIMDALL